MAEGNKQYDALQDQVETAHQETTALNISAGNSKVFYGGAPVGEPLDLGVNQGIIEYDPAELVMVVRSGTSLLEVQAALDKNDQMLGFEPPYADKGATIGGAVASGLAGAARPYRGGVRDYLLGAKIINGRGEICQFGGKVMKNVAGFDLFRPMAGAMGTLGVLLEVSIRLLPKVEIEKTFRFEIEKVNKAISVASQFGADLVSLSAFAWHDGQAYIRLSGTDAAVKRDQMMIEKSVVLLKADSEIWRSISEFSDPFFNKGGLLTLASLNLPPATELIDFGGAQLIDWGGGRRYLKTALSIEEVRKRITQLGGSATELKGADRRQYFQPLPSALMAVHSRFKLAFDPRGILNPGRLYPELGLVK